MLVLRFRCDSPQTSTFCPSKVCEDITDEAEAGSGVL